MRYGDKLNLDFKGERDADTMDSENHKETSNNLVIQ